MEKNLQIFYKHYECFRSYGMSFSAIVPLNNYCMKENQTLIIAERPNFTIIRKDKQQEVQPAKMVPLKKIADKALPLLPPPQEKYIKARKHDFL